MTEFEFAVYTEITDLAFELRPELKEEGYERFFICEDIHDIWFVRILKGMRDTGADFVKDENNYLLERNMIFKNYVHFTEALAKEIILEDCGETYDNFQSYDLSELIESLNDGFGINNLKES